MNYNNNLNPHLVRYLIRLLIYFSSPASIFLIKSLKRQRFVLLLTERENVLSTQMRSAGKDISKFV